MNYALEVNGLRKVYAGGFEALKGIDLKVREGDFYALLGPNGAGKSTTIGIISSLINKTEGEVKVFSVDLDTQKSEAKKLIGLVPQEFNFNQFEKVFDIVVTQAGYYGIPAKIAEQRAEKYLRLLGLWDKANVQSRTLSGGMKRRLMIARALVHEPRLLILDEPTAGVDIELRRSMWEFLRRINQEGTTIILTTHYLEEAEQLCRNVGIIDKGEIVTDTSVKALLKKLDSETLVLDVEGEVDSQLELGEFPCKVLDEHSIEVEYTHKQSLNQLFELLAARGIVCKSMRNKANRLEELFVRLVEKNLQDKAV